MTVIDDLLWLMSLSDLKNQLVVAWLLLVTR